MRCGVVYRLTFANGQQYVGSTVKQLNARMHNHRQKVLTDNSPLYVCWREQGEPFAEIIAGPGLLEADLRKREFKEVESLPVQLRLNVAPGGMNGAFPGNQHAKGNILPQDIKDRLRCSQTGNRHRLGIPHSSDTKNRISASLRGRPKSEQTKQRMREAWARRRERAS